MDQVTQQNAAMVEESTAASHALSRETEELARLIGGFKVGQVQQTAMPTRPASKAAPISKAVSRAKPVAMMRTTGSGGASRKPETSEDWQEF